MKINSRIIWIIALALGWCWDFLFWDKIPGISFAIFVLLCVLSGFYLFYYKKQKPSSKALWLLMPIVVFSAFSFIRKEPLSQFLSISVTLLLLQILTMSILGNWMYYGFGDYFVGWLRLLQSILIHPIYTFAQPSESQNSNSSKKPSHQFWQVVRGLLIALPIVIIFTVLLSSADAIFAQKVDEIFKLISLEKLPEYILRTITILILAYSLVGVYFHALEKSASTNFYNEKGSPIPAFLGYTEATIVLGSVTLLFASFVIIQFQYFFGGQANIHINGYTYSEYARRGFGELLAVALLTLLLLLVMSQVSRRENSTQQKIFTLLSFAMVALVGIILISAFERLLLYESAYGFTRLRTYTHIFIIWLGALLIVTVLLEMFHRLRFFANATLLAALGFSLTINLMNVDGFIAQKNVQRDMGKYSLDASYLAQLSTDAVPSLVSLFRSSGIPDQTKETLGASLVCMYESKPDLKLPPENWQSFELSRWRANNTYKTIQDQLSKYKAVYEDYEWEVTSPQGHTYRCEPEWRMD